MTLLSFLSLGKRSLPILEQPQTSVMDRHIRLAPLQWWQVDTWMGMYGGKTPKPTKLLSPHLDAIAPLHRKMPKHMKAKFAEEAPPTTYSYYADGRLKTQPCLKVLKKSQEYPEEYGQEVVKTYQQWRNRQLRASDLDASSSESDYEDKTKATWPEARLESLAKTLLEKHPQARGHF